MEDVKTESNAAAAGAATDADAAVKAATGADAAAKVANEADVAMKAETDADTSTKAETTAEAPAQAAKVKVETKNVAPPPKWLGDTKKRFLLLLGYNGIGYHGLQINHGVPTIEAALEAAIAKLGVIHESNMGDLSKSSWSRCARTDKGVHALGNVISLRLRLSEEDEDVEAFRDALNAELDPNIRVFEVVRAKKNFHAKNQCTSRKYEYHVPTFMLRPRPELQATAAEASDAAAEPPKKKTRFFSKDMAGQVPLEELLEYRAKLQEGWNIDSTTVERFRETMAYFRGTHNFHNFSPAAKEAGDASSKRFIMDVHVDEPRMENGVEMMAVHIHGQSFMLHQIRNMVGTALEVVRRGLDPKCILSYTTKARRTTVMIPGEGLLLRSCHFKHYNADFGEGAGPRRNFGHAVRQYTTVDFERPELRAACEAFAKERVFPAMVRKEIEEAAFSRWLYFQDKSEFLAPPVPTPEEFEAWEKALAKRHSKENPISAHTRVRREREAEARDFLRETVSHLS